MIGESCTRSEQRRMMDASYREEPVMRRINPTLVRLVSKPKNVEGRVSVGELGYTTHLPDVDDNEAECNVIGVRFTHCHIWLNYGALSFLVPAQMEAPEGVSRREDDRR